MRLAKRAIVVVLFAATAFARIHAQGSTGSLAGTVRDEQGLVVPGVTVTLAGTENTFSRTVTTSGDGGFELPGLLPGDYKMTVELTGFTRQELAVHIEVNQRVRTDVVLKAGGLTQQVQVTQTVPLLHVSDATVGEVIDQRQVAELPLNGRQFLELALLVPGAHTSHGAQMGDMNPLYWRPGQNSAITISGGRPNSNVYLLDGTVNTDPTFNTFVISLPPDAIREFQIQTGTYTAELGGAGTGQINVVTKSGTFKTRGSVYEYVRNSKFDSPEFTNPDELPPFKQNQFGGTLGGAGGKGFFFFGGYEGLRTTQHMSNIMFVPDMAVRSGDFSGYAPIYDPLTNRANPAFNPALPVSPANPQFIRDQFPGNKIPANRINSGLARRAGEVRRGAEPRRSDRQLPRHARARFREQRLQHPPRSRVGQRHVVVRPLQPERRDRFHAAESPGLRRVPRQSRAQPDRHAAEPDDEAAVDRDAVRIRADAACTGTANRRTAPTHRRARDPRRRIRWRGRVRPAAVRHSGLRPDRRLAAVHAVPVLEQQLPVRRARDLEHRASTRCKFGGDARKFNWDMLGFFQNRGYFQFTTPITSRTSLARRHRQRVREFPPRHAGALAAAGRHAVDGHAADDLCRVRAGRLARLAGADDQRRVCATRSRRRCTTSARS